MILVAGVATLGFIGSVFWRFFRPIRFHLDTVADRRHVAPNAMEKPVALSDDETHALDRLSSRGLSQPYTATDMDSLKAIWAVVEKRTGKNVSERGARNYAGGLREAYNYLNEFQNCLLASYDSRMPVTTPKLLALRKRVVQANVAPREKVSSDSSLIHEAATRIVRNPQTGMRMPMPRQGMVLMLHRIEQLGRNVDFLDSALAVTSTR
ncbi:MAG TPA: hypothetical protein VER77_03470 [Candidatus Dormibacteraeota bacterium]|nr:hypothetical protein [Candidatus Dormibacteraeota bacterium]